MKNITVFVCLFCCFAGLSFAELNWSVEYVQGIVEVLNGKTWELVSIGDEFSNKDTLKLAKDAIIELTRADKRLVISQPGTYALAKLEEKSADSTWGMASYIDQKVNSMLFGYSRDSGETAMGSRGKKISADGVEYYEEESDMDPADEIFATGKDLINNGDYDAALKFFTELNFSLEGPQKRECTFYIGYLYFLKGQKGPALHYLSRIEAEPEDAFFPEYAIIKGQLLLESLAYSEAIVYLKLYADNFPQGTQIQLAYYLLSYCYAMTGDSKLSRQYLVQSRDSDPESDIGRAAAKKLKGL